MSEFSSPNAQPFFLKGGDHAVLLIHGFTGSPGHMRPIGEALHRQGFTVQAIALPGHIESVEAMARVGWQHWLQAAREAAAALQRAYPRVSVAGLSMGGDIALILAQQMELTACISLSAPMGTTNRFRPLALLAAPFLPVMRKRPGGREGLDPAYDFGYDAFPTKSAHDLSVLLKKARRDLALIRCPLLAVQSRADRTITRDSLDIIHDGVSSPLRARLWLEDVPHVITISSAWPHLAREMADFLHRAENNS